MKMRLMFTLGASAALLVGSSLPAAAQMAETVILEKETITGVEKFYLAPPPVGPLYYTLPMDIRVDKDDSISTSTPITDQYAEDLPRWLELVRECLTLKPKLIRVVDEERLPFILKEEGTILLNANDKPVCPSPS